MIINVHRWTLSAYNAFGDCYSIPEYSMRLRRRNDVVNVFRLMRLFVDIGRGLMVSVDERLPLIVEIVGKSVRPPELGMTARSVASMPAERDSRFVFGSTASAVGPQSRDECRREINSK